MNMPWLWFLVLWASLSACTTSEPTRSGAAERPAARDPAPAVLDTTPANPPPPGMEGFSLLRYPVNFTCGAWHPHARIMEERVIADLQLVSQGRGSPPSARALEAIRAAGGKVLHTYHVPMVRTEIDTAAVPRLATLPNPVVHSARIVTDTTPREVTLEVNYDRLIQAADAQRLVDIGARNAGRSPRGMITNVPDSTIRRVKTLPGVTRVELAYLHCGILE